jgi:hypothetical protein
VLREGVLEGRIHDFYVVVESYGAAYGKGWLATANRVLPPNVFYMETPFEGGIVRSKVAVISAAHLARLTSAGTLNVSLWARFAQPVRLPWVRDDRARQQAADALAQAVRTVVTAALPLLPGAFTSRQFWEEAFANTYRAELRAEKVRKNVEIYDLAAPYYDAVLAAALAERGIAAGMDGLYRHAPDKAACRKARRIWALRRVEGKALTVLRLMKAAFTFEGGADYIVWKISRHSGVSVELTPWQRRHPLLAGLCLFARLWRQRAFR